MGNDFEQAVSVVRAGTRRADDAARGLVARLDDRERLGLLDGDQDFWAGTLEMARHGYNHRPIVAGAVPRLGIPGLRFTDGPRGVVMGHSTCFPVSMARGATWDVALEEEIGRAIGLEGRAQGATFFGGVCVNLLRHPAWGRAQETYGEDPVLLGAMGAALTRGVRPHLVACVKHYALNSIENARFVVSVEVDEESLHEVYLPHFRAVIEAGAESVMSAYNAVNGRFCGEDPLLLTDVLREEWGFEGVVVSDFVLGLRDAVGSVRAGLDVEMPFRQQRARALPAALASGVLAREDVARAAVHSVAVQIAHAARVEEPAPDVRVVACESHRALARRAAAQGMVLLRNEDVSGRPVLPLERTALRRVALIGRLAAAANLGDLGSSAVRPPSAVSPLAGLRAALPGVAIEHDRGRDRFAAAARAAACDAAIVVVGYGARDEGEAVAAPLGDAVHALPPPVGGGPIARVLRGMSALRALVRLVPGGDRARLSLKPADEALIEAVSAVNPRTIVVVIGASAVLMERWRERVPAILLAWYPGMEGGHALADVLLGRVEPGGRLPFAMARDASHLPHFDSTARSIRYDGWWGQRKLDRDGQAAAFPLGFGLGYTRFGLSGMEIDAVDRGGRRARVSIELANFGARDGATVVQLYVRDEGAPANERPRRQLVGFTRVALAAGARARVGIDATLQPISRRDARTREWSLRAGRYRLEAAQHCGDAAAVSAELELGAG